MELHLLSHNIHCSPHCGEQQERSQLGSVSAMIGSMLAKNAVAAALAVVVLAHDACSFTAPTRSTMPTRASTTKLYQMDGPPPGTKIVSNNKEVQFDGIRFYETGVEGEDVSVLDYACLSCALLQTLFRTDAPTKRAVHSLCLPFTLSTLTSCHARLLKCIPNEEFCVIDPESAKPIRLTVEEKERMFLDALQSYYASGRQIMDDAEFDALKDDLMWNGSDLVNLNRREISYLDAMQGFNKGAPTMSDAEFDALREELRDAKSVVAVEKEPTCYIEVGVQPHKDAFASCISCCLTKSDSDRYLYNRVEKG